ncbi:hypothetical protein [Brachybacterium vulturis]|nr:hypothetical protein [Brachybacterium vulturis]
MPYMLGCVVAWVSNEVGIGITQLNGIVVALVMVWVFGVRSGRPFARAR